MPDVEGCSVAAQLFFRDVIEGAGAERVEGDLGAVVSHRTHHDYGTWPLPHNLFESPNTVEQWHFYVEGNHIRFQLLGFLDCLYPIIGESANLNPRSTLEHSRQYATHHDAVIDNQHFDAHIIVITIHCIAPYTWFTVEYASSMTPSISKVKLAQSKGSSAGNWVRSSANPGSSRIFVWRSSGKPNPIPLSRHSKSLTDTMLTSAALCKACRGS